ncbi:mucin-binding protein, partial [Lacticaseibacillus sp. GG6-2]
MSIAGGDFGAANSFTQTVSGPIAWPNVASNFSHTETAPGKGQGSIIGIWGAEGNLGQNTYSVYEPIFYFDVPTAFVVDGVENAQGAVITEGVADNGDTVVKVDFTGTGESVDVSPYDWNLRLHLALHNAPDAMVGSYPWYAYVTSPTTSLVQTQKVTDLSQTMGDANAILVGTEDWQIDTISGTYAYGMAQGDDLSATTNATIDKNSTNSLKFYDTVMNISGTDVYDVTSVLNLPEVGDDQGSTYTFNLTGPVTLPQQVTTQAGTVVSLSGAQVLYSTSRADLTAATPDLTGYVTADQVGSDWSTIRSVALAFPSLPAGVTTGRIILAGTTTNMNEDAGKIGYLSTSFSMGKGTPAVVNKAASIAITGQSTIHARAHYVDADGNDQYVAFTDLDKTYTDNADTLADTDFPETPSDADIALIPTGYVLHPNSLHFVDGSDDGVATVGQTVTDAFDGDYAQYELDVDPITYGTATTTRTIHFVYADGTKAAEDVVQTVPYKTTTDSKTGETVYTPQLAYNEVTSPE